MEFVLASWETEAQDVERKRMLSRHRYSLLSCKDKQATHHLGISYAEISEGAVMKGLWEGAVRRPWALVHMMEMFQN